MAQGAAAGLRVVIGERNPLARRGLLEVLSAAGALVIAAVGDAEAALRAVAEASPDVLVAGLDLTGLERGHVVAIARDRWPGLGVVALSDVASDEAMLAALQLGASAYLPRTAELAQFVVAVVQAAAAPGAFVADDLLASRRQVRPRGPRLTPREADVLALAAEGLTVAAISQRLFVSEATTRSHLSGIYRKLRVTTRSQAVLAAERLGMLSP